MAGIGSAIAGGVGSSNAAHEQETAAEKAQRLQRQVYQQQQTNYAQARNGILPWQQAGQTTLADMVEQMQSGRFNTSVDAASLVNDPGYQFRMAEGQKALERSASARGFLNSGGALKSLERYSQGFASNEFNNAFARGQSENAARFGRMSNVAGMGQNAANSLGQLAMQNNAQMGQYANNMSELYGAAGNARAAGAMGTARAFSDGFGAIGQCASLVAGGKYGGGGGGGGGGGAPIPPQGAAMSANLGRSSLAGWGPNAYDPNRGF
ncbi:MAG: hypothetical protein ACREXY_18900 [Gammaproteobacteria bacterium]